ncbi:MAG TPA: nitrilase-related carbon-nitrogen hydrolase, partial [Thermomicrobiales bacterium]|nr:nitrilase-related carbon-nitrogen hydrolase [Thermomicrobiales bacterium]
MMGSTSANGAAANIVRVAAVQMNSRDDKDANIAAALALIDRAAAAGARLIALPEVWTYLGP